MDLTKLKKNILALIKKYVLSEYVKKFVTQYALKAMGLTGFVGMIAAKVIPYLVKLGFVEAKDLIQKGHDKEAAKGYADEMAKGKDSNEKTKLDYQHDILNGGD